MPTQRIIKKNAKHDTDNDGVISDEEVASSKELLEIELREEKSDAQRRMAKFSTRLFDSRMARRNDLDYRSFR